MHVLILTVDAGPQYALSYREHKQAVRDSKRIYDAKKDDPVGEMEISDDFGHIVTFRPADIKCRLITDVFREKEADGLRDIVASRAVLKMRQEAAKDSELQAGIQREQARQKLIGGQPLQGA